MKLVLESFLVAHCLVSQHFSQHLAVLRADQLVKTRKEAQTIYYSLANDAVIEV